VAVSKLPGMADEGAAAVALWRLYRCGFVSVSAWLRSLFLCRSVTAMA
jgi:hypothetical protein